MILLLSCHFGLYVNCAEVVCICVIRNITVHVFYKKLLFLWPIFMKMHIAVQSSRKTAGLKYVDWNKYSLK